MNENTTEGKLMNSDISEYFINPDHIYYIDDSTGRNAYYYNFVENVRTRTIPASFVPTCFETGDKRYFFRGSCIRCRKKEYPGVISLKKFSALFALNLCATCIVETTPDINKIQGNGDIIWEYHRDTPKMMYYNLVSQINDSRDKAIVERARKARYGLLVLEKKRRDLERWSKLRTTAKKDYNIREGRYLSWGFGKIFDEYFGNVHKNVPHGNGVKIYSDGRYAIHDIQYYYISSLNYYDSIYVGNFHNGSRHTLASTQSSTSSTVSTVGSTIGIFIRPNGYEYEGTWMLDMKHGEGRILYPDGSIYNGEIFRDYEHGYGKLTFTNGDVFEGKYRFGKREGPGTITKPNGAVESNMFRDYIAHYTEKSLPHIIENDDDLTDIEFIQPLTLLDIALLAMSTVIRTERKLLPSENLKRRLPEHLKPLVALKYLSTRHPAPSQAFTDLVYKKAFIYEENVEIDSVKMLSIDTETVLYFQQSNHDLRKFRLIANKLDSLSIQMISYQLSSHHWYKLHTVDLSFNAIESSTLKMLCLSITDCISVNKVKLAGCGLQPSGAYILAQFIESNKYLTDLDVSFNNMKGSGAESIADALTDNSTLLSLNIRSNNIGVMGGQVFAEALKYNKTLRVLVIADNKIGMDSMTLISARASGSLSDILLSNRSDKLQIPVRFINK